MKEQILKLREEGKTYNKIKEIVGCSKSTISYHCGTKGKSSEWKRHDYTKEELTKTVKGSLSIRQVINKLNLNISSSSYKTIKSNLDKFNIDYTFFKGQGWAKDIESVLIIKKNIFIERYLKVLPKKPNTHKLKLRLYRFGFRKEKCQQCLLGNMWNGEIISLHLDHINGNNKDNRLENLRILCPNCHSQTETYAGKNVKLKCSSGEVG